MAYKAVVAIGASSDFVRNKDVDDGRLNRAIDRKRRVVGQYSGGTSPKIRGCDFIAVGKVCCNGKIGMVNILCNGSSRIDKINV